MHSNLLIVKILSRSPKGSGNNKLIVKLNRGVKVWEDSTVNISVR